MPTELSRRGAVAGALAMGGSVAMRGGRALAAERRVEVVAFDALTIFDPRSVVPVVEESFPGRGVALSTAWRARLFDYGWLRTLTGVYADFWQITGDALDYTLEAEKLAVPAATRARLMEAYLRLEAWPDSAAALKAMAGTGIRLAYLSNFTVAMLEANSKNAGIAGLFDKMLSADAVRAFKPDPRAYGMAETMMGVRRDKIVFAAYGGWDAAGAKTFGFDTFWVNRLGLPVDRLGERPDAIGGTLTELARYVMR
jgi:2-haloacid dehalogenase